MEDTVLAKYMMDTVAWIAAPAPEPSGGVVQNPAPQAPPGVEEPTNLLMAYLKWGVLVVIVAAGFVGAGAVAGGRILAHHGASKIGIGILLGALAAAVAYVGLYAVITSVAGL
jgi:hypothetical protein